MTTRLPMSLLCLVAPAMGLYNLAVLPSRSALLIPCATARCAPPLALGNGDEAWVDITEDGEECVLSDAGATCLEADVAGPIRFDELDLDRRARGPATEDERRRRSPGMIHDFGVSSTEDFKRPYVPGERHPPEPMGAPQMPPSEWAHGAQMPPPEWAYAPQMSPPEWAHAPRARPRPPPQGFFPSFSPPMQGTIFVPPPMDDDMPQW
jgi:hypothetical protein